MNSAQQAGKLARSALILSLSIFAKMAWTNNYEKTGQSEKDGQQT